MAEVAEKYVKKGTQIYIEGRIRTRAWDDRDGNKRYTTEIVADNMQMMGKRGDSSSDTSSVQGSVSESTTAPKTSDEPAPESEGADDLPF